MSLTLGTGPFAKPRRGDINVDLSAAPGHLIYVHEQPGHIRGVLAGKTIVDSENVRLLHETAILPQWYFPLADIDPAVLRGSDHTTHCPFKGDARYWHIQVGERIVENAIWNYPLPLAGAPDLSGLAGFYFDRLDGWFEEDEPVVGHPRDPFHRVDTRRSSREVTVSVHGDEVARTGAPIALFETGLPVRWYVPAADIDQTFFADSATTTYCPYKGTASYLSYRGPGGAVDDVAWIYRDPFGDASAIAGYASFDGDGVEVKAAAYPAS